MLSLYRLTFIDIIYFTCGTVSKDRLIHQKHVPLYVYFYTEFKALRLIIKRFQNFNLVH